MRAIQTLAMLLTLLAYPNGVRSQNMTDSINAQDNEWTTILIPDIGTFQIPQTMEVKAGLCKILSDYIKDNVINLDASVNEVIAQQKGLNDSTPEALSQFCRIIVNTTKANKGDFAILYEHIFPTTKELEDTTQLLILSLKDVPTMEGIRQSYSDWQTARVVRAGDAYVINIACVRRINDGSPVVVNMYYFQNNDYMHIVEISYRESEASIWAKDMAKAINTFKFIRR